MEDVSTVKKEKNTYKILLFLALFIPVAVVFNLH